MNGNQASAVPLLAGEIGNIRVYETHQIVKESRWSESTVKKYVAKARREGLLYPALVPRS